MTRGDFARILQLLEALWPAKPIDENTAAAWWRELADQDYRQLDTTVRVLHRTGARFMPTAGELLRELTDLRVDALSFGEAWSLVQRAIRAHGSQSRRAIEWLEERDHRVALLADMIGLREIGMAPEGDRVLFAQARDTYDGIVRRERRHVALTGLPAVGLRELERLAGSRSAPRPIGDVVQRALQDAGPHNEEEVA